MKAFILLLSLTFSASIQAFSFEGYEAESVDKSSNGMTILLTVPTNLEDVKKTYELRHMLISQLGDKQLLLNVNNENLEQITRKNIFDKNSSLTKWRETFMKNYFVSEVKDAKREVKVALIDTGFIRNDIFLTNKNIGPENSQNHGTHVGGIILAVNPYVQMYSYNVYVEDDGWKTITNTVQAVDEAIKEGVDVINLSWGESVDPVDIELEAYKRAEKAGILIVVAAGNDGKKIDLDNCKYYPACYKKDLSNMIVVGNMDEDLEVYKSSNTGNMVDIYAYGTDIKSLTQDSGFKEMSGTSMAAPFITGFISQVLMSQKEKLSISDAKDKFFSHTNTPSSPSELKRWVNKDASRTIASQNKK